MISMLQITMNTGKLFIQEIQNQVLREKIIQIVKPQSQSNTNLEIVSLTRG